MKRSVISLCSATVVSIALSLCLLSKIADAEDETTTGRVCKAGIALIMGRDPAIIRVDRFTNGVAYLRYTRPDDGTVWRYKCKLEGAQIIWGADDGRWRTHPDDEVITYIINQDSVVVRENYADGSNTEESFPLSSL
jgi:hypothetical protein